jgi:hypothetical protein
MPIVLLIHVLKKQQYVIAVLTVDRSKVELVSRKVFIMMRGIYRRETKESAAIFPAIIGAVRVALVDSG